MGLLSNHTLGLYYYSALLEGMHPNKLGDSWFRPMKRQFHWKYLEGSQELIETQRPIRIEYPVTGVFCCIYETVLGVSFSVLQLPHTVLTTLMTHCLPAWIGWASGLNQTKRTSNINEQISSLIKHRSLYQTKRLSIDAVKPVCQVENTSRKRRTTQMFNEEHLKKKTTLQSNYNELSLHLNAI